MPANARFALVRYFALTTLVLLVALAGTFAITGESDPQTLIGKLADVVTRSAEASDSKPQSTNEEKNDAKTDKLGDANARLIYGMGELPLYFPDRRDRIWLHDPVNGPYTLNSVNDFEPAWSPDGTKIAFISLRDGPTQTIADRRDQRELYMMNPDGTDQERLGGYGFGGESQPSFSPDGRYIVYSADYSSGGGSWEGIYIYDTFTSTHTPVVEDIYSHCDEPVKRDRKQKRERNDLQPGSFGPETPVFSPDGQYILFGYDLGSDRALRRIKTDGTECTQIYLQQSHYDPLFAQYSPDGTKIALAYGFDIMKSDERSDGSQSNSYIIILDADGSFQQQHTITHRARHLTWSPNGEKIAYIASTSSPFVPNGEIWSLDITNGTEEQIMFHGSYDALRGLSWGIPSSQTPTLRLKINDPHPVFAGTSTTGTVYLAAPAPAGGAQITLSYSGDLSFPRIFTLPETVITIPEGQTEAVFDIDVPARTQYRSADVSATIASPYGYAKATVTVVPPKPDLAVTTFTAPALAGPGSTFTVNSVVTNIGLAATGNSFVDRVYFSTDEILDGTDGSPIGIRSQTALAPGAATALTPISVNIPVNRIPSNGTYYLIYETNSTRTVDEHLRYSNNLQVVPIQIDLPDIISENLSVPTEILPITNYPVTWNVRNAGAVGTNNSFTNRLFISFDETIGNADDVELASRQVNGLAAGATASHSATLNIPTVPARTSGPAIIYAVADVHDNVFEGQPTGAGEQNNTASIGTQFSYQVSDLQVTSSSVPVEVESDTAFAVEWTTANTGNRNAGSFSERVFFSVDQVVNANDVSLGTFAYPSGLAGGENVTRIQNVSIPTNQVPATGSYWIYVRTDINNTVNEGEGEGNNIRWHPVDVRRLLRPDLVVSNVTAPTTANFDQTIQVQWTVTNNGQGPTNALNWKDSISVNTNGSTTGQVASVDSISFLNAGESYIASAAIKIPRGYVGSYKIVVETDRTRALNEENTSNNTLSRDILLTVPPLPDMIVNNVQAPAEAFAGGAVSIKWTAENIGDAAAKATSGTWRDRVFLSTDQTFSPGTDRLIFTSEPRVLPLAAGDTYVGETRERFEIQTAPQSASDYFIWRNISLPANLPGGQYYVFVMTDAQNAVYEFNSENNNVHYDNEGIGFPMTVISTPVDLVSNVAPTSADNVSGGQRIPVSFTIKNQGAFATWRNWKDGLYLSSDQTWSADDVLLGSVSHTGFAAGEERTVELNVKIPDCLNGTYYLIAKADYKNDISEFDPKHDAETNNDSPVKEIQITTQPSDMVVTNVAFPPITTAGQTFDLTWTVANNGTGPASGAWTDRIMLVSNSGMGTIHLATVQHTGPLAAGASYTRSQTVTLPQFMQGEYQISVETDHGTSVTECGIAEENNIGLSQTFSLESNLPDLVIDSINLPVATIQAGSTMQIEWTGRNQGSSMPANIPGWVDRVYLSADLSIGNNDWQIGSSTTQLPLAAGQTYQKQLNVNVGNVPAGNYYILVVADFSDHVFEGPRDSQPETNNRNSVAVAVTSPGIDLQAVVNEVTTPTYSGQPVNVRWTVTNHGSSETLTGTWTDYIILSRDSVIDSTDPVIGWRTRAGTLAGGAAYVVDHAVNMPPGLTGTYRIFVNTDRNNNVVENNDTNNISSPFSVELELPPPADLNVTNISVPASASPGDSVVFGWTLQNSGSFPSVGPWRDSVYLSLDPFWDAGDVLLGQRERTGLPLGTGATESHSKGFTIPSIDDGEYYVIVRLDSQNRVRETNEANNVSASAGRISVGMQTLTLGVEHNTTLSDGGFKAFKFEPGVDETVLVTLNGQPGKNNGLFSKYLTPVNLSNYEFRDDGQNSPNKENFIAVSEEGPYFSMVTNEYIPQNLRDAFNNEPVKPVMNPQTGLPEMPQNISVKAEVLPFSIHSVYPERAGNAGIAFIDVIGAKFEEGSTIKLIGKGGAEILPRETMRSSTVVTGVFNLTDKTPGHYTVQVTNPDEETTELENGFEIVNGGGFSLHESVDGPRSRNPFTTRLRYTFTARNDGLNDALFVPVVISMPENMTYKLDDRHLGQLPDELLPANYVREEIPQDIVMDGRRIYVGVIPILRARSSVDIGMELRGFSASATEISFKVIPPFSSYDGTQKMDIEPGDLGFENNFSCNVPLASGTNMEKVDCWSNFLKTLAFAILNAIPAANCIDDALAIGLGMFDTIWTSIQVGTSNQTASQKQSAIMYSFGEYALTFVANIAECAGQNIPWFYVANVVYNIYKTLKALYDCLKDDLKFVIMSFRSHDPNEMIGPEGYGPEKFVPARSPLFYRINFENMPDATAPAQRIHITDVLPAELDPRTVRLKEISFNQQTFVVPDNQAFYSTRVDFDAGDNQIKADISAGLDIVNRRVIWTLTAIDPNTGERPLDPLVGLLPPNNEDRDGEGYVTFTVEAYNTFPNRTPISNFATIFFDENEAIVTNTETNLLDSVVPASQIAPLPATSDFPEIPFSFSGTDDSDGSGLARCNVYVSENGGTYLPVLTGTELSGSGVLEGKWGTNYRFYTRCSDNAGNLEPAPLVPDAEVNVLGGAYESDVSPRPSGSDGVVNGDDVAQIRRFIAKLDAAFTYNEIQRVDTAPSADGGDGRFTIADVIQARRFVSGADQRRRAAGPNELLPEAIGSPSAKKDLGSTRNVRPVRMVRVANKLYLAIEMDAQGDEAGVGFTMHFDPQVLSAPSNITAGNGAENAVITVNDSEVASGKLGLLLDNLPSQPVAAGTRRLITMEFDIAPPGPAATTISFSSDLVAEEVANGDAEAVPAEFRSVDISLLSPTSAGVEIAGRVLTARGEGVPNATVTVTAPDGSETRVLTSSLGFYRVTGLTAGRFYILTAKKKGLSFEPRGVDANSEITGFDLIASP